MTDGTDKQTAGPAPHPGQRHRHHSHRGQGISDNLVKQCRDALEARELVKGKVLENSEYDARSACAELCERTAACPVQVIGSKFVLYRPSHRKDKKDKIVLVKGDK